MREAIWRRDELDYVLCWIREKELDAIKKANEGNARMIGQPIYISDETLGLWPQPDDSTPGRLILRD